jgi:hypothetical protein
MVGAEGFKLMYFQLDSCGMSVVLQFLCFSDLSLKGFCWVYCRNSKVVLL